MGASKLIRDVPTAAIGAITGEQATLRPRRHMLDGTVTSVRNTLRAAVELRPLATIGNALNVLDEALNDATDALTGEETYIIDTTRNHAQKTLQREPEYSLAA